MEKKRIAVLVSGGGTNLQALFDAQDSGIITDGEIVLVISSNDKAYALTRAANRNVKTAVFSGAKMGHANAEQAIHDLLIEDKIDLVVLAGYMSILSENFTAKWPEKIINVHPALIPSFCGKGYYGLYVHKCALEYGVKVTGATVHFVNEVPDGGRIIAQKAVDVRPGDTPEVLQRRVMEQAEWIILPRAVQDVCAAMN